MPDLPQTLQLPAETRGWAHHFLQVWTLVIQTVNALSRVDLAANKPAVPDLDHIFFTESDGLGITYIAVNGAWRPLFGGGGFTEMGNATVDFGAFPGTAEARTTITGQSAILTTSSAHAWVRSEDSADHSAQEHSLEDFAVHTESLSAGNGFTIVVHPQIGPTYGVYNISWAWGP